MRVVARQALAILRRQVLDLGLAQQIIVTRKAKLAPGLYQQFLICGLVRVMATGALAIIDRHVFDFGGGQKILMAGKTKLAGRQSGLRRHPGIPVALAAFAFRKGTVDDPLRFLRPAGSRSFC